MEGTRIGQSLHEDLTRNMVFVLRSAFVETLQAKQVLDLARADLDYYDKIIDISRNRLRVGDLAQIDFDRIELLRVQYESELQTAIVNLRTAKIQLLQRLNDRTPVDQFDVSGPFDFSGTSSPSRTSGRSRSIRVPTSKRRFKPLSNRKQITSWRCLTVRPTPLTRMVDAQSVV